MGEKPQEASDPFMEEQFLPVPSTVMALDWGLCSELSARLEAPLPVARASRHFCMVSDIWSKLVAHQDFECFHLDNTSL